MSHPRLLAGEARGAVLGIALGLLSLVGACRGAGRAQPTPPAAVLPAAPPPSAAVEPSVRTDSLPAVRKDSVAPGAEPVRIAPKSDSARATGADVAKKPPTDAAKKKPAPSSRNCVLDLADSPPETRLLYQRISEGVSNTFVGGGFVGRCQGENNRLRADSAEQFEAAGIVNLFGSVTYEDLGKMQIRAEHAVYFTREGRLYADGNVVATQLRTGSTFAGPTMEYYRSMPDRPLSLVIAPQRSTITLMEKDSTGTVGLPTNVVANRFQDSGDSLLYAWGDVLITRERLTGRADSSSFDKISETTRLMRDARIIGNDTARSFTLMGDTIDLYGRNRKLDRVIARHAGRATTADMQLEAESIDLRLKDQQLTEAFAFGTGRARAKTPQQDVDADSLHIRMSAKVVREVRAVGGARAMGIPDTMQMRTTERDVLRGDSIYAYFDSSAAAAKDTLKGPSIEEIRALGNASSLFHVPSNKGRDTKPAINYVRGVRIYVNFDTGAIADVRVDSAASGVYIEPEDSVVIDTTAAKDSAASRSKQPPNKAPKGTDAGKTKTPPKPPTPASRPPASPAPTEASRLAHLAFTTSRRRP